MKKVFYANLILITLNSISTAIVKLLELEFEMELFRKGGLTDSQTIILGVIQLIGALMLIKPQYRKVGAGIMAATYCVGTFVVFNAGMTAFGFFSILFIAMSLWPAMTNKY